MKIQNNNNNVNFGIKLDTAKVLEVSSQKIFKSDGVRGWLDVMNALSDEPVKVVGARSYKFWAKRIGDRINAKYPEIANASEEINKIYAENANTGIKNIKPKIQPIIDKLGANVDITI